MLTALRRDVRAALDRDPAARSALEVIICYPGVHALCGHRASHWLWRHRARLPARARAELTRVLTGVDIHPAAAISPDDQADQRGLPERPQEAGPPLGSHDDGQARSDDQQASDLSFRGRRKGEPNPYQCPCIAQSQPAQKRPRAQSHPERERDISAVKVTESEDKRRGEPQHSGQHARERP